MKKTEMAKEKGDARAALDSLHEAMRNTEGAREKLDALKSKQIEVLALLCFDWALEADFESTPYGAMIKIKGADGTYTRIETHSPRTNGRAELAILMMTLKTGVIAGAQAMLKSKATAQATSAEPAPAEVEPTENKEGIDA